MSLFGSFCNDMAELIGGGDTTNHNDGSSTERCSDGSSTTRNSDGSVRETSRHDAIDEGLAAIGFDRIRTTRDRKGRVINQQRTKR